MAVKIRGMKCNGLIFKEAKATPKERAILL